MSSVGPLATPAIPVPPGRDDLAFDKGSLFEQFDAEHRELVRLHADQKSRFDDLALLQKRMRIQERMLMNSADSISLAYESYLLKQRQF